jgi:hypothetical protein
MVEQDLIPAACVLSYSQRALDDGLILLFCLIVDDIEVGHESSPFSSARRCSR